MSCEVFVAWQVVQWVFLTSCSHRQGLLGWRVEFREVDDLKPEKYQNKFGPLEDLLEVATPMGSIGQHSNLAWDMV